MDPKCIEYNYAVEAKSRLARAVTTSALSVLFVIGIAGCGGGLERDLVSSIAPPNAAPVITQQPQNESVPVGQSATFSIVATGTPTPTYQWLRDGTPIAGATSTTYTTPATQLSDSGATFTAQVENSQGSVTSNPATLTVTQ
jgi:hypothetical protein